MTWLKLDDGFADHPKIDGLSDGAFRVHVAGMLYAARHLTDGTIPARAVPRLVPGYAPDFVGELVDAELWHEDPDGSFTVHDWLEWNPSAAETKAKRRARADAGRKGGLASARTRNRTTPDQAIATANAEPNARADRRTPSRPVPSRPSSSSKPPPPTTTATAEPLEEEERRGEPGNVDEVLRSAALILADRVLVRRDPTAPPILNPAAWITATATDRTETHRARAAEIVADRPTIPADELADLLEPDLAPTIPRPPRDPDCPDCAGSLWVDHLAGHVAPCQRCNP